MGLGVGAGLGMMLPGMLMKTMQEGSTPSEKKIQCPKCHSEISLDARFCPSCGTQIVKVNKCLHCGKDLPLEASFCMVCGTKVEKPNITCSKCGTQAMPGAVFCNQCGEKL
jgi:predicted amidophosphoribosyltransferase